MKARQIILMTGLAFIIILVFTTPISVFAAAPIVVQNNETDQNSSTAITSTFVNAVTVGDLLVYQIFENQTNGGSHKLQLFDNVSTSLTLDTSVNSSFIGFYTYSAIYHGIAAATKIRVTLNSSSATGLGLYIWEVSGLTNIKVVAASVGSSGGCGCSLNSPITSGNAPSFAIGGAVLAHVPNGGTWTPTSGYISVQALQQVSIGEFLTSSSAISSEFPVFYNLASSSSSALSGAIFYSGPAVTTTNTQQITITSVTTIFVPPSPVSLHFWWYPAIVIMIFASPFIGVAFYQRLEQQDTIHMVMLGVVQSGFVAFAMQILPLAFLMFMSAGYVAFLVLSKG